jgi:hypothetical protein
VEERKGVYSRDSEMEGGVNKRVREKIEKEYSRDE